MRSLRVHPLALSLSSLPSFASPLSGPRQTFAMRRGLLTVITVCSALSHITAVHLPARQQHPHRRSHTATSSNALDRRASCAVTADCQNTPPANANRFCADGICSFRCRTGFTLSADGCSSFSVSSSTASAAPAAETCTISSACESNTRPANSNAYCDRGTCSFRCRSGFTLLSGSVCVAASQTTTGTSRATTSVRTTTSTSSRSTTTSQTAASCAPRYTGATTTIVGTGTLPKPTAFVKRSGQQLKLSNANYRIVGPNIYWLCSDENDKPWAAPPDKGRVREAMAIAVAMGANTIRVHTCGISVGLNSPYSLMPSRNTFQESLWDIRDYVLYAAREYGLRVILPLTDNYDYYHGGKYSFIDMAGLSRNEGGRKFYEAKAVIAAFKEYITAIVSRVNSYTGIPYFRDPTILAWETGNELGGYINAEMWPPASWTNQIIDTIRKLDTSHLIIDGSGGFWNYTNNAVPDGLNIPGVDIMSDHGYPRNTGILKKEIELAKNANKAFFIGEYDWTTTHGGVPLKDYLAAIEASGSYLGDMIWNVMGHDAQCCAFVPHNDGYSAYYPNGNSAADQANLLAVARHWYKVTGRTQPSQLPAVLCPQPHF